MNLSEVRESARCSAPTPHLLAILSRCHYYIVRRLTAIFIGHSPIWFHCN